jgi:hypothetical protein
MKICIKSSSGVFGCVIMWNQYKFTETFTQPNEKSPLLKIKFKKLPLECTNEAILINIKRLYYQKFTSQCSYESADFGDFNLYIFVHNLFFM